MSLKVNLNNSLSSSLLKAKLEDKMLGKQKDFKLPKTSLSQISHGLNKNTILQLQELQEFTSSLFTPQAPQKPEAVNLDKEVNPNDTPRLSWLIGKDDDTYNWFKLRIPSSIKTMETFRQIVESTKDDQFFSPYAYQFLCEHITSKKSALDLQQKARDATDDPIVHKVLDYTMPKTQARLQLLQDYLASKPLNPQYQIKNKDLDLTLKEVIVKPSITSDISFIDNAGLDTDYSKKLLEFLAKDLRWYEWYLRDDETEALESLPLTRVLGLAELMQPQVKNLPVAAPAA